MLRSLRLVVPALFAFLLPISGYAQPVVAPLTAYCQATATGSDSGPAFAEDIDQPTCSLSVNDAGQLSDPFGSGSTFAYQSASASGGAEASVEGPLAPWLDVGGGGSGTQGGIVPSTTVAGGSAGANQEWQFAFYAPTFTAQAFAIPIAFKAEAIVGATGSSTAAGFTGQGNATVEFSGFDLVAPAIFSVTANSAGPTADVMDQDIVTGEGTVWTVSTTATAGGGGADPVVGPPGGSAIGSANVNGVMITVDYVETRQLILNTTPLSAALADQGLAELTVIVSPEVSPSGFAAQFAPVAAPVAGLESRIVLVLLLVVLGGGLLGGRLRAAG